MRIFLTGATGFLGFHIANICIKIVMKYYV